MTDVVTRTVQRGLGGRLKNALGGIIVGALLIAIGLVLLFWNESRAVKTARALEQGADAVISLPTTEVSPEHDGRLVHLTGKATTDEELLDPVFGIRAEALALKRDVEVFQWTEKTETRTRKKVGGGEEKVTTYRYQKEWVGSQVDSSAFEEPSGHENPSSFRWPETTFRPQVTRLGEFELTPEIATKIRGWSNLPVGEAELAELPVELRTELRAEAGNFSTVPESGSPRIGDHRVFFRVLPPATISVVCAQQGSVLVPWASSNGRTLALVEGGTVSADSMFESAERSNRLLTWLVRAGGFVLLWIGFGLLMGPIAVLADILPPVGAVVRAGTGIASFLLAAAFSSLTIAIGWITFRPLVGIGLLVVTVVAVVLVRRSGSRQTAMPSPPPPPPVSPPPPPP